MERLDCYLTGDRSSGLTLCEALFVAFDSRELLESGRTWLRVHVELCIPSSRTLNRPLTELSSVAGRDLQRD